MIKTLLAATGFIWLAYFAQRPDTATVIGPFAVLFGLYLYILYENAAQSPPAARVAPGRKPFLGKFLVFQNPEYWIWLGLALRFCVIFSQPNLSDDFYRFLWDGHLLLEGINPFAQAPVFYAENGFPPGIPPDLYAKLNSPRYFTVYPPVCEGVFAGAVWFFPKNEWAAVVVIKAFLFACECGTVFLLRQLQKGLHLTDNVALLYALNPLALLEITGNCHFEGAMIFFLLAGLHCFFRGKMVWAAVFWAFSVATKLVPLMFLPLVLAYLLGVSDGGWGQIWRRTGLFFGVFAFVCGLLFAPMFAGETLVNMSKSLDLYFQKFEFNASIYYLLRMVGFWVKGYNIGFMLGPVLAVAVVGGAGWLAWRLFSYWQSLLRLSTHAHLKNFLLPARFLGLKTNIAAASFANLANFKRLISFPTLAKLHLLEAMLALACVHLLLAPTVHPWYLTLPLALCGLTRWRFPVIWSGAAILSYTHYVDNVYLENYGAILLEYALVLGFFYWEWRGKGAFLNKRS